MYKLHYLNSAKNLHITQITWVLDAPHWSLCSSLWSSLSPVAPLLQSHPPATDPAITRKQST